MFRVSLERAQRAFLSRGVPMAQQASSTALSFYPLPLRRSGSHGATTGLRSLFGAAVMAALATSSAPAMAADPVFGGSLTAAQQAELLQWGQLYWNRVEGVPPPAGSSNAALASFSFSLPAMNSELFNPFYGPRQTLIKLNLISANDCMKQLVEQPGTDAASVAKRAAIKDSLLEAKFKTDPVTDPAGTVNHVIKILDAGYVAGLVTYTEDGKLVSKELPLDVLVEAGVTTQVAEALSGESVTALLVLSSQLPGAIATISGATEAQAALTGQASKADAVASRVTTLLNQAGVAPNAVERMDAIFSVYGQLPMVYVAMSDCAVLLDATTGAMSMPMMLGSPLSASALLAQHDAAGDGLAHRVVSKMGCVYAAAPSWQPTRPPGYGPRPAAPQGTAPLLIPWTDPSAPFNTTVPRLFDPTNIGWFTHLICVDTGAGCLCVKYGLETSSVPGSPIIFRRVKVKAENQACHVDTQIPGGLKPPGAPLTVTPEYYY